MKLLEQFSAQKQRAETQPNASKPMQVDEEEHFERSYTEHRQEKPPMQ